jgi:hypothetical protein
MISSAIAMLLLVAAPGNPASQSRDGYANCLRELVRTSAEKKLDASAFDAALGSACRDKEASFKNAMVESEVKVGIKRAVAEQGIQQEIADYRVMAKEEFQAELASPPKN